MGKSKHWVYAEANGCTVGLMKCCSCGKKITEGEFRYYETEEAYVCQCKKCGGSDNRWVERDRKRESLLREQWIERARTEHTVLLSRIENAYREGWYDANTEGMSDIEEDWENSEAKRIHDTLKELWSRQ